MKEHSFDYTITSTSTKPSLFSDESTKISSIQLKYEKYQSPLSLWRTMVDEVRLLKVPIIEDDEEKFDLILLGMGSMAWSGGMYNCQPFCLYR